MSTPPSLPTSANPTGFYQANVPAPTRDTEFSIRAAHQFGDKHSGYAQYSYQDWTGQNQAVGGQTLAAAGYNNRYHEDDTVVHADSTLSASLSTSFPSSANTTSATTRTTPKPRASASSATSAEAPPRTTRSPPNTTSASTT